MLLKYCTQYVSIFGKLSSGLRTKVSFHPNPKEGQCQRMHMIAPHVSKVMLKILKARLQQYVNWELPDVQDGFRKGRGIWDQITNILWIIEKAREFQKTPTVWITTNYEKFFKRWEYQTTLPASWETCMQVKKQQLELDMEQQTGSKSGKEYVKAVYCHTAYLTSLISMQKLNLGNHGKCWAGWITTWNQNCWEKYQ